MVHHHIGITDFIKCDIKMIALLLIILSALFFPGTIGKTKAILSGRKGAGIFQPMKDIIRLLKKGSVYSQTTSYIFQYSMPIYLATIIVAACIIPYENFSSTISFNGDFIFFAYVIGLGRFLMVVSALDTGSGFEGMGANREVYYALLIEPAFFILIGSLALFTGYTSFNEIFINLHFTSYFSIMIAALAVYLLAQITLVENSRLPVDDPKTHLELTMVHEVMVLDHSGFDLALIHIGNALKFSIFGALVANCVIPTGLNDVIKIGLFMFVQFVFAISIGIFESFRARNKMERNSEYIINLSAIAVLLIFVVMIINHNI
jgi:formate hydrogenlyase subunit 4